MRFLLIISMLILLNATSFSQPKDSLFIGKRETIYSNVLKENRTIRVYTPGLTSLDNNNERKYPVLYILDGEAHFLSTVGIIQQLSQANGNGILPEMIVVAIENTNRTRDLTPAKEQNGKPYAPNPFVNFLSSELIPYIDKNYSTAPYRLLVGHSLGGLTAINILTHSPSLFHAYIAIDPSMWFDNERFLNQAKNQIPSQKLDRTKLFIGIANTMPKGMALAALKTDKTIETTHIRAIYKLDEFLKGNKNGLQYASSFYEKEGHNSVPLISEYDGLRYIFDYYPFEATIKDFLDTSALIANKLKAHYTKVSREMGYANYPPESFINYLGYEALFKKQFRKSGALFQLNLENFPQSSNALEAYGDFCIAQKDTVNAVAYYRRSLEKNDKSETRVKLNNLTKKGSYMLTADEAGQYTGTYLLEAYNLAIVLENRNGRIWSKVPGQADDELLPISKDVFTITGKQGYRITFQMEGNQAIGFTSIQPNGTFKAVKKR
ncbi:hypothetical protein KJS94_02640 [Flavihumibacter rivuli]|uniref:alpha/beta hydrolase-fold protein n=1 Tax=Flavihumibacter rivuli TaxID=2838156 RepID=UPI001BDF5D59|nr:alpha/beta hydrolase-fold protein [Flavihumibacter rivuli]ULQ57094.1 hypothetical protein KJS94_02640 [Flavihumibacter rivuli]